MKFESIIGIQDQGQRVDRYIKKVLPSLGLSRMYNLFRRKEIKINKKPIPRNQILNSGEVLEVFGLLAEETEVSKSFAPQESKGAIPFPILFEDSDLLIINKPSGVAVHPGSGIPVGATVIEQVEASLGKNSGLFKPSLVHRIDRDTSGILLMAKSGNTLRTLNEAMKNREVEKKYLALVEGEFAQIRGELRDKIAKTSFGGQSERMRIEEDGKEALSYYEVLERFHFEGQKLALLSIEIKTGRTHQIRTQFSHAGHSLLGDNKYGNFKLNQDLKKKIGLKRLFLHATSLKIEWGGKSFYIACPLGKDLDGVLNALKKSLTP